MKLKPLVRHPSSSIKQELEQLGEVWLKIPMWGGQLMNNRESLRISENTRDRVQRMPMSSTRGGMSHRGGKRQVRAKWVMRK